MCAVKHLEIASQTGLKMTGWTSVFVLQVLAGMAAGVFALGIVSKDVCVMVAVRN